MDNKNKSGQSPLFPLSAQDMTFPQYLVLLAIVLAELAVMYFIQNYFSSSQLQIVGIFCLLLSLLASSFAVVGYCKHLKQGKNKK